VSSPLGGPALHGALDLSSLVRKHATQAPSAAPASPLVRDVDDTTIGELVELSKRVPVILEVYGGELAPALGPLIESYAGAFVLGTVRGDNAPELVRALGIQGIPTVVALVAGQPVPLFQGIPPEPDIKAVLEQVLALAAKGGVTGRVTPPTGEAAEPVEEPLPPLHQEAYDALGRNDIAGAKAAFQKALAQNPADSEAEAGLAQVELLERVSGLDADRARKEAAAKPKDLAAALAVADIDISGGRVEEACERLLALYSDSPTEDKDIIRTRLLAYFILAGATTEPVKQARNRLSSLMF
jgi:putative thioredoxin